MSATTIRFTERRDGDSEKWRRYAGRDVIPAWVADMDCVVAEPIMAALRARLEHGVFGYSSATEKLPRLIADYFSRRWNWQVQPDWLLYSPGLGAGIHNVCRLAAAAAAPADILTPSPIYHVFRKAPALAGARRLDVVMRRDGDNWTLPLDALEDAVTPQTRVLQLCNPHNPNGKVYSRDELTAIGEFCVRHNLIICADEVHADLILDEDKQHIPIAALSPQFAARCITMQSPSKAFNIAGLNFAVIIISDPDLRRRYLQQAAGKVLSNLNPFGFVAAAAAWGGDCDDWLIALRRAMRDNRDRLAAAVEKIKGVDMPPLSATYLAWLNVAALQLADAPAHFIKHGVGMSPGADFGDGDYMRLNFGCSPALLDDIIERLRRAAA